MLLGRICLRRHVAPSAVSFRVFALLDTLLIAIQIGVPYRSGYVENTIFRFLRSIIRLSDNLVLKAVLTFFMKKSNYEIC